LNLGFLRKASVTPGYLISSFQDSQKGGVPKVVMELESLFVMKIH